MRKGWAILGLLLACSRRERGADAGPPVATVPAVQAPQVRTYRAAQVLFDEGVAEQCLDVTVDATLPRDAGPGWQPQSNPANAYLNDGKEFTDLARPCSEEFKRPALATCKLHQGMADDAGVAVDTKISIFYYGYRSAGSTDEEHQTCLKLHGTWDSLPEDSREWKAAKLDYHVRELKKHAR